MISAAMIVQAAEGAPPADTKIDIDPHFLAKLGKRLVNLELEGCTPQQVIEELAGLTARPAQLQAEYREDFADHLREDHHVFTEPVATELAPGLTVVVRPNAAPTA